MERYSVSLRIQSYLSVFSPNAGKYGPEKFPYLETFHAAWLGIFTGELVDPNFQHYSTEIVQKK